jgi:hypothetical protein
VAISVTATTLFSPEVAMKSRRFFLSLPLCAALVAGCQSEPTGFGSKSLQPVLDAIANTPVAGPVTIRTALDFSSFPFHGTFAVVQGASALGCSGGTFVDHWASVDNPGSGAARSTSVRRHVVCTSGGTGTFVVNFEPNAQPGPGDFNGRWNALSGTGDFSNLRGEGDYSSVISGATTAEETLTGTVHFDPK